MNKKKHTIIKNNLYSCLSILTCIFLFGCNTESTPPIAIPTPPLKQESVVPHLSKIDKDIEETIKNSSKIDEHIEKQKQEVLNQKLNIAESLAQAEKIKEKTISKKIISELEAINLVNSIKKIEARNLFLENQINELKKTRTDQDINLSSAKNNLRETHQKLLLKEEEANKLREQNSFLSKNLQNKNNEVESYKKTLEKEKIKSAKAGVYKNWVIWLVIGFIVWTIIKNILMIYSPSIKFRV